MTLTPTNRFINVTSVSFLPTGGSAIPIKGVTEATIANTATDVNEGGDADIYNTVGGVVQIDPIVTLSFMNVMALNAVAPGTSGTLTFTLNDSRNFSAVGGGAIIFTVINCYLLPDAVSAPFRQLARNSVRFRTFSADGVTNPVSSAAA